MAARRPSLPLPHEKIIRDLESDLYMARRAIIELMPDAAKKVLDSFDGKTRADVWIWAETAAQQIVNLCEDVTVQMYDGYPLWAPRAVCPLCGGGSSAPYENGFALPTGLERHLLGSHNSHQCDVFGAAVALAKWRADSPL